MKYNPEIHRRRSIRLKGYDYSQAGAYFITLCTKNRQCLFGHINDGKMVLNEYGTILEFTWNDLPNHNNNIILDAFVIMPNHIHGIVIITDDVDVVDTVDVIDVIVVGAGSEPAPTTNPHTNPHTNSHTIPHTNAHTNDFTITNKSTQTNNFAPTKPKRQPLYEIVRQLKTFSAKRINELRKTTGQQVWQRNYYEHIIRNEYELNKIREYILNNPLNWKSDDNYKG